MKLILEIKKRKYLLISFLLVSSFFSFKYLSLISQFSVNLLTGDQWDFFNPLFYEKSIWEIYNYLHAPHKQGIGFVIFSYIHKLSSWNIKLETYILFFLLILILILFLNLKKRLFGKFNFFDLNLIFIILSLNSFESFLAVSNPSHGITPLFLLALFCISIQKRNFFWMSIFGCLMIHSGFGIMIFPVTISILFLKAISTRKNVLKIFFYLSFILLNFVFLYLFLFDYPKKINAANSCFHFPHMYPIEYLDFISFQSMGIFNILSMDEGIYLIGLGYFVFLIFILCKTFISSLKNSFSSKKLIERDLVIFSLCSFTVLFCINTAIGRVCSSIFLGQSSRYYLYLIPGLVGFYFYIHNKKFFLIQIFIFLLLVYSQFNFKKRADYLPIKMLIESKLVWRKCILEKDNIDLCQAKKGFQIYPNPNATNMRWKLDYMKKNKLNLYSESL